MCLVCLRKGLLPFGMCLVCLRNSMRVLFSDPLSSFLSLMKEKKAKENQGDDRLLFFRVLDRWNESVLPFGMYLVCLRKGLLPFGMCLVCLRKFMGALFSDPLSSFLSLMKEKKAKENQGDDRLLFFRVLDRWNESVLPFGGMFDR